MRYSKIYCMYIMTNQRDTVFYIGVTSNLLGRVWQHKTKAHLGSFTARYNIDKLVYFAEFSDINEAISYEKKLKKWHRQWKINLIKRNNPGFNDLSKEWYEKENGEKWNRLDRNVTIVKKKAVV